MTAVLRGGTRRRVDYGWRCRALNGGQRCSRAAAWSIDLLLLRRFVICFFLERERESTKYAGKCNRAIEGGLFCEFRLRYECVSVEFLLCFFFCLGFLSWYRPTTDRLVRIFTYAT